MTGVTWRSAAIGLLLVFGVSAVLIASLGDVGRLIVATGCAILALSPDRVLLRLLRALSPSSR